MNNTMEMLSTAAILLLGLFCLCMGVSNMEKQIVELGARIKELEVRVEDLEAERLIFENALSNTTEELKALKLSPVFISSENEEIYEEASDEPDLLTEMPSEYGEAAVYLAKTVWGEARGLTQTEKAAVVWCILNRVDSDISYFPDEIIAVITQKNQFVGYRDHNPVDEDILALCEDVIVRWLNEKTGVDVGRVLPKEYLYFYGDGKHNHFTKEWQSKDVWDWSLKSPY